MLEGIRVNILSAEGVQEIKTINDEINRILNKVFIFIMIF
jgi:hypothetical protein